MATESRPPQQGSSSRVDSPIRSERNLRRRFLLIISVFFVANAGLAYELVAGSMATYLVGQSITQFSFATGWFLAAMGLGSYVSRFTRTHLLETFVVLQMVMALVGGFSAAIMFLVFAHTDTIYPIFISLALVIGTGMGMEIPLVLRLVSRYRTTRLAVSDIFTWDYIGALLASLLFPLVILPTMGLIRTALFFGFLNTLAAWITLTLLPASRRLFLGLVAVSVLLVGGFIGAERLTRWIEDQLYQDPIVLTRTTPYQRIVITRWQDDVRLYLNGNLQFSSRDEARYHETIVHVPIMAMAAPPQRVLVLGGGDGLVVRELTKHKSVKHIDLVDLDRTMIGLFRERKFLRTINRNALNSPRLRIHVGDAFRKVKEATGLAPPYDLIIADLPDPNNHSLGKLYSVAFYLRLFRLLSPHGILITQATSPVFAPDAFWSIHDTLRAATRRRPALHSARILPLHVYVPSFGDWGFVIVGRPGTLLPPGELREVTVPVRFISARVARTLFVFSSDYPATQRGIINRLNSQKLVRLYSASWARWFE